MPASRQYAILPEQTIFIWVYGVVTLTLPSLYFFDIIVYEVQERTGIDPPLDWSLLEACDLAWMVCLALSTRMAVPEPPIHITRRVLSWEEMCEVEERAGDTGLGDNGLIAEGAESNKLMV